MQPQLCLRFSTTRGWKKQNKRLPFFVHKYILYISRTCNVARGEKSPLYESLEILETKYIIRIVFKEKCQFTSTVHVFRGAAQIFSKPVNTTAVGDLKIIDNFVGDRKYMSQTLISKVCLASSWPIC